jgi:hypothetical protein
MSGRIVRESADRPVSLVKSQCELGVGFSSDVALPGFVETGRVLCGGNAVAEVGGFIVPISSLTKIGDYRCVNMRVCVLKKQRAPTPHRGTSKNATKKIRGDRHRIFLIFL